MSILNPAAAAPTFMNRYQRLKPALRDRFVVNRWQADWNTVWMAAMNGAMSNNRALAINPRWGMPGVNPTITTASLKPSKASIERFKDLLIPSQSVYIPETNSMSEV